MNNTAGAEAPGWLSGLQAGLIAGLMAVIFSISHATLVTGAAAPHATAAVIGMALVGTAVLCFLLGAVSGVTGLVPMAQDVPAAAIGAILVAIVADRAGAGESISAAEVVLICLTAGLLFSAAVFIFGRFHLAGLMRYAPRPVLAGFLAGTGYFMVVAALGICLGASVTFATFPELFGADALPKVAVAFAVTATFFAAERVLPPSAVAGVVILSALALFHLVCGILGYDLAQLGAAGWTAQLPDGGLTWPPVDRADFAEVDVRFLLSQIFPICTMIFLATAALLMNSTALEAKLGHDLQLDGELKALGASSFVSTVLGGLPGYHGVSSTMAGLRIAGPHRVTSFVAGGMALTVFLYGNAVLAVLPLPILAGFMLWVGAEFLRDWLIRELRVAPVTEGWLTVLIFLMIAGIGLFEGTVFGLVAGAALFVVNYSRLDPVRNELSGDVFLGATERSAAELAVLQDHGRSICLLKLQGFIFFGTAHSLRQRISARLQGSNVRHLIVDFEAVTGVDATAVESFQRLSDTLVRAGVRAHFTSMSAEVSAVFARAGMLLGSGNPVGIAPDMDSGLALAQSQVFAAHGLAPDTGGADIKAILSDLLSDEAQGARLAGYLERVEVSAGAHIVHVGHEVSDLYVLESGSAEVLVGPVGQMRRVRSLKPGAIIGEIAYLTEGVRSSSVRARDRSVVWRFSAESAQRVMREDPELSSRFHQGLARLLAERVRANTRLIEMLQA